MKWQREARKFVAITLAVMVVGLGFGQSAASARETTGKESGARVLNAPAAAYPFSDNVEDITANIWLADSPWSRTTTDSHSGNTSWTDSPGAYYGNNINVSLTLATPLDLSSATNPRLKFWHHYQLEPGFDFGYVEISTNGGANWTALASYSGTQTSPYSSSASIQKLTAEPGSWQAAAFSAEPWVMEQINLSTYAGQSNVKIRFRLVTDGSGIRDGWYIDDVAIADLPAAVTLSSTSNATRTSLNLSWSQNTGANFSSYVIYRGLNSNVDFRSTRVTTISSQNTTSFADTGLAPKTTYYYKVYVVSNYEIYSASNEQSGTTLAGLDYPFYDNMEAGPNNWIAEPSNVWTLVTPDLAHSGNKAWTDSPSGDYGNNVDASLTLANDIDINPLSQFVFWHRLNIAAGDQARVELST
ncbi:MAG: fibronectin type III domain-containing protein, partial [Chloroflexota bacterium]